MALFAYTVHIDGKTSAGELDAGDERHARRLAHAKHRKEGASVAIGMVFRPPPRLGTPRPIRTMPTQEMRDSALRAGFQNSIYERSIRRERRGASAR